MSMAMTNWTLPSLIDTVLWWALDLNTHWDTIDTSLPEKAMVGFLEIIIDKI